MRSHCSRHGGTFMHQNRTTNRNCNLTLRWPSSTRPSNLHCQWHLKYWVCEFLKVNSVTAAEVDRNLHQPVEVYHSCAGPRTTVEQRYIINAAAAAANNMTSAASSTVCIAVFLMLEHQWFMWNRTQDRPTADSKCHCHTMGFSSRPQMRSASSDARLEHLMHVVRRAGKMLWSRME